MIISFVGVKGGQGKSTLAVRLGASLAVAGHRTVLLDLSSAASSSALLGYGPAPNSGAARIHYNPGRRVVGAELAACHPPNRRAG